MAVFYLLTGLPRFNFSILFGIDFGQSFLNVTMTLTAASRYSYGRCNSSPIGVKSTIFLGACQAKETYNKSKLLFILLKNYRELKCVYACYFNVINIATGLRSHFRRHKVSYCIGTLRCGDILSSHQIKFGSLQPVEENLRKDSEEQIV